MSTFKLSNTLLLTIAVFATALVIQARTYNVGLSLVDEGIVVEGARLYRAGDYQPDAFGHYSSRFMFEDLILRVFGDRLTVLRAFWTLLRAATAAMVFWCVTSLAGAGVAFPVALVALLTPGPWHAAWLGFLTMAVMVALLVFRRRPRQSTALIAGLIVGFSFGIHPLTGALMLPAAMLGVNRAVQPGRSRLMAPLFVFAGAFLGVLVFGGWVRKMDWGLFATRQWSLLADQWNGFNDHFIGLIFGTKLGPLHALAMDWMLVAIVVAIWLFRRKPGWLTPGGAADIFSIAMVAAFCLPRILVHHDAGHLVQNLPPFLVLFGVLCGWGWRQSGAKWLRVAVAVFGVWLLLFALSISGATDYQLGGPGMTRINDTPLENAFAPVLVSKESKTEIEATVNAIWQAAPAPTDTILVLTPDAMFYALADRPAALPVASFSKPIDLAGFTAQQLADRMQAHPPQAIVHPLDGFQQQRLQKLMPHLDEMMRLHYGLIENTLDLAIYQKKRLSGRSEPGVPEQGIQAE